MLERLKRIILSVLILGLILAVMFLAFWGILLLPLIFMVAQKLQHLFFNRRTGRDKVHSGNIITIDVKAETQPKNSLPDLT